MRFLLSIYIPSVGVKEGLGWVFSSPQWHGKSRNLPLPWLQHSAPTPSPHPLFFWGYSLLTCPHLAGGMRIVLDFLELSWVCWRHILSVRWASVGQQHRGLCCPPVPGLEFCPNSFVAIQFYWQPFAECLIHYIPKVTKPKTFMIFVEARLLSLFPLCHRRQEMDNGYRIANVGAVPGGWAA